MSAISNIAPYIDYFRQLAVSHSLLQHNADSESADAPQGEMHFAKWNFNELTGSLRTKLSFPAMLVELYETQTEGQSVYDIKQRPKGAITILQHVKEGDIRSEEAAYALTEKILYDILKQIWQDHYGPGNDRCLTPFYQFRFGTGDIRSTGKLLQNEMGWRIEFSYEFQNTINITQAPDPGEFINYLVQDYSNTPFATAYVDYFRQLAVSNRNLLHNQASETGDAPQGQMHFTKWNVNELISGLRTKVSFPAMLLELYEVNLDAETPYDIKPRAQGAITIIDHVKEGDIPGEETAYALTESILYDILKQMWQDHYGPNNDRCKTPFYQLNFNKLDISTTGKIFQNEMGWRAEFYFEFQKAINITIPPDPGTFLSVEVLGYDDVALGVDDQGDVLLKTAP